MHSKKNHLLHTLKFSSLFFCYYLCLVAVNSSKDENKALSCELSVLFSFLFSFKLLQKRFVLMYSGSSRCWISMCFFTHLWSLNPKHLLLVYFSVLNIKKNSRNWNKLPNQLLLSVSCSLFLFSLLQFLDICVCYFSSFLVKTHLVTYSKFCF